MVFSQMFDSMLRPMLYSALSRRITCPSWLPCTRTSKWRSRGAAVCARLSSARLTIAVRSAPSSSYSSSS
jgi:hypothetical protein